MSSETRFRDLSRLERLRACYQNPQLAQVAGAGDGVGASTRDISSFFPLASEEIMEAIAEVIDIGKRCDRVVLGRNNVREELIRGEGSLLVLAADARPSWKLRQLERLAKEAGVQFVYVASRFELATASWANHSSEGVTAALIKEKENSQGYYMRRLWEVQRLVERLGSLTSLTTSQEVLSYLMSEE